MAKFKELLDLIPNEKVIHPSQPPASKHYASNLVPSLHDSLGALMFLGNFTNFVSVFLLPWAMFTSTKQVSINISAITLMCGHYRLQR